MRCICNYIYNCFVKKEKPTPKPNLEIESLQDPPILVMFTPPDKRLKPFVCSPKAIRRIRVII